MIRTKGFSSLKLSHKFTLLIIAIIVMPLTIMSLFFWGTIRDSWINEKVKTVEINFTRNYEPIQKNVEICQLVTQVVLNDINFWNQVERFCEGNKIKTEELIDFYRTEINAIEKLINTNPYLTHIRVYADYQGIPEMMPILYRLNRMECLVWTKEGSFTSGSWYMDYADTLFPAYSSSRNQHLAALITTKQLYNGTEAVIEVATDMELLFSQMYSSNEKEWTCFVGAAGAYYCDWNYESRWSDDIEEILRYMPEKSDDICYEQFTLGEEPVIVCYKRIKELGGILFQVVSLEEDYSYVNVYRNVFWGCFCVIVFILLFFSNKMVKIILKQFYVIMDVVHEVQKGDLKVRVADVSGDEIGELGQQINQMLAHIIQLMDDSIKREILVKDSEIRALQNQINAHFIYNVLESIKMMAEVEEKCDISDAITALGKMLRYSMGWVSQNVTVAEEIEYVESYLALINFRFDYETYLSLNIPKQIYEQKIPKMSIQPIIENAIHHGIEELSEDTNIYMKGILYEDYCVIEITDAGRGMTEDQIIQLQKKIEGEIESTDSSSHGIGLKNVQDRIKISFGEDYGISIASKKDCYTKVMVRIPFV